MRRLGLFLFLALALAACAPVLEARLSRQADDITVTVSANADAYSVTLSVLDADTSDERCAVIGEDFGCVLGDIGAGQSVVVTGVASGEVSCVAFGFSDPDLAIRSYRPYRCSVGG